jgi:hypothetical protein
MDENNLIELKTNFNYRYEIYFLLLCRKFLEIKKEAYNNLNNEKVAQYKENILALLCEMNNNLASQVFLLSSTDNYIIRPIYLLKLWDSSTEEYDIQSYLEINLMFMVKTYLKTQEYEKAFNELEIILTEEGIFDRSQILIYYFGKVLAKLIDTFNSLKDGNIISMFKDEGSFIKIRKIIKVFGQPNSNNYKRKAKNYTNLVKIAEFFKADNDS